MLELWDYLVQFLVTACGFCAAKGGAMDVQSNKKLSSLIVTVANPMQILASALTGERLLSTGRAAGRGSC